MISRVARVTLALAIVLGMATGCQPEPEPSPTGPVFATEEEAFAAAEETYRAYVDALNQVDLSDPETFEAVYAWTTGDANAQARETFSEMHADKWTVSGASIPTVVEPRAGGGPELSEVEVAICLDVSAVQLLDATGQSVIDADRPDVQSMLISMNASAATDTGWAIS
ncbi:MAG TPA: hypothetical protein VEX12_02060, partial [Microbacterium sp.]|nr:hypothetical protein [Microbacterium sp.]